MQEIFNTFTYSVGKGHKRIALKSPSPLYFESLLHIEVESVPFTTV
jgi:hypothetical protein